MVFVSQLGEVMVSMASNLMLADERFLWMAQREALACSRIITCLQKIAAYRLATAQAFSLVRPTPSLADKTDLLRWVFEPADSYFVLPDVPQHCAGGTRRPGY